MRQFRKHKCQEKLQHKVTVSFQLRLEQEVCSNILNNFDSGLRARSQRVKANAQKKKFKEPVKEIREKN